MKAQGKYFLIAVNFVHSTIYPQLIFEPACYIPDISLKDIYFENRSTTVSPKLFLKLNFLLFHTLKEPTRVNFGLLAGSREP